MAEHVFIEFGATDTTGVGAFLAGVFGWTFHPMGSGGGWLETPDGRHGLDSGDPQPQTYAYLPVSNLDAAVAKIRELGGTAEIRPDSGDFGRFADCKGPGGIPFGLHQKPA